MKKLYSAIKKMASKIKGDYVEMTVIACSLIVDVATLSLGNFWVTLVAVLVTLICCVLAHYTRTRYYMVSFTINNGNGAEFFSRCGELDIAEARRILIHKHHTNVVIHSFQEVSRTQTENFCSFDFTAFVKKETEDQNISSDSINQVDE